MDQQEQISLGSHKFHNQRSSKSNDTEWEKQYFQILPKVIFGKKKRKNRNYRTLFSPKKKNILSV